MNAEFVGRISRNLYLELPRISSILRPPTGEDLKNVAKGLAEGVGYFGVSTATALVGGDTVNQAYELGYYSDDLTFQFHRVVLAAIAIGWPIGFHFLKQRRSRPASSTHLTPTRRSW